MALLEPGHVIGMLTQPEVRLFTADRTCVNAKSRLGAIRTVREVEISDDSSIVTIRHDDGEPSVFTNVPFKVYRFRRIPRPRNVEPSANARAGQLMSSILTREAEMRLMAEVSARTLWRMTWQQKREQDERLMAQRQRRRRRVVKRNLKARPRRPRSLPRALIFEIRMAYHVANLKMPELKARYDLGLSARSYYKILFGEVQPEAGGPLTGHSRRR